LLNTLSFLNNFAFSLFFSLKTSFPAMWLPVCHVSDFVTSNGLASLILDHSPPLGSYQVYSCLL
jgi:hypothetical protein